MAAAMLDFPVTIDYLRGPAVIDGSVISSRPTYRAAA
jgi:hypothetical protein